MPTRQDTFRLVPTTLINTTGPRPPMTSKAAKKAYREANKLPRISRAEQRRNEAAEIARQKREYEKEKAAAKAKASREKKLRKEAEERTKRKELGLPEPSRFVRQSQPTIKTFVRSGAGRKRVYDDVDTTEEEHAITGDENHSDLLHAEKAKNSTDCIKLEREDWDDEFGDFPSLSQADLPNLFAEQKTTSALVSVQSSSMKQSYSWSRALHAQCEAAENVPTLDQSRVDTIMAKPQSFAEDQLVGNPMRPRPQFQFQTSIVQASSNLNDRMTESPTITINIERLQEVRTSPPLLSSEPGVSMDETSKAMPPPAIPTMAKSLRSRSPLNQLSRNLVSLCPPKPKFHASTNKVQAKLKQKLGQEYFSVPPPSTLAFLEAHLDDFFPSPSQQVRELLEDVDDMPSNTQVAKEIGHEQTSNKSPGSRLPSPLLKSQVHMEEEALYFLSSQDLEISSQDLRDIDTPSKAIPSGSHLQDSDIQILAPLKATSAPPPTPKSKGRFFEEKEDDILHAVLHESFLLSGQTTQGFIPRKSKRILRRTRSSRTDSGHDGYESDGSDLDVALIALMDKT